MRLKRWVRRTSVVLLAFCIMGGSAGIPVAIVSIIEAFSPGAVMCPIRNFATKIDIEIPTREPTAEEAIEAKAIAAEWKQEALKKFPELRITPREIPDEENGFLQLFELNEVAQPTEELDEQLHLWEEPDIEKVTQALANNTKWVEQLERIANLSQQSNLPIQEGHIDVEFCRLVKKAHETFLWMALLAAERGDEKEALRCMQANRMLIGHLQHLEAPNFLYETITILCHLSRHAWVIEKLLPAIGETADLEAWRSELNHHRASPQRMATLLRGEWQWGSGQLGMLMNLHQAGAMRQPHATAMAYAKQTINGIEHSKDATLRDLLIDEELAAFHELPDESRGFLDIYQIGSRGWNKGYIRSDRMITRSLAALDLLMLENSKGLITASDTAQCTLDPYTGDPFVFDPEARTIVCPGDYPDYAGNEPLKLPW